MSVTPLPSAFLAGVLRKGLGLGVAYGIWAALGVTLTVLLAALIFGEALTPMMLVGVAMVIGGVLCVELGSHKDAGRRAGKGNGRLMMWLLLARRQSSLR